MSFKDKKLKTALAEARKEFKPESKLARISKSDKLLKMGNFRPQWELCKQFRQDMYQRPSWIKLRELRKMAEYKITNYIPYAKRRAMKHPVIKDRKCWVCKERPAVYQHHIIQIQYGGYDNGVNRIPICHPCHIEIHDFMKEDESEEIHLGQHPVTRRVVYSVVRSKYRR